MPLTHWLGWILGGILLLVGFLGAWLPLLPGMPLMLLGALTVKLLLPGVLSWWTILIFALTALVALGLDAAATVFTSRFAGATKPGVVGALVGGFVGLFFALPGLLLGPFLGAVTAELVVSKRKPAEALKAGFGAALGFLAGAVGKGLLALFLLAWFAVDAFLF